jgi:hypothetical protein
VEDPEHFSIGSFPVFKVANMMDKESIQQFFYGIPILEYPGLLKVRHYTITSVLPRSFQCNGHPLPRALNIVISLMW